MESLNEKSKSKSQQRLMGMVHAYKKGDLDIEELPDSLGKKIKGIADGHKRKTGDKRKKTKGMGDDDVKDFASTKHKGLPEKVKENLITKFEDFINESLPSYNPYSNNDQQEEKCPDCGETERLEYLGPKDYKRDDNGNYRRTSGYRCKKCKCIFSVDKK